MDFIERITEAINTTVHLPVKLRKGYLGDNESLVIYPLPGGQVIGGYYDGTKINQLNYEIAMKSKDGSKLEKTLWALSNYIESLDNVNSSEDSFEFNWAKISNKPFINEADDQGWLIFMLGITVELKTK